jgi:2-keto-4-pentenoate hydratase/2-oxohepta-3-ene-1,7-dioic acid hydratase in catechol pathway
MRLYAYYDRFGDERFGVLVEGRLLTGAQLEKRGRLDPAIDTHLGIGFQIGFEDDWLGELRRAARRALKAGAPLLDLDARRPAPAMNEIQTGKIVCIGLNYGDHAKEGGRAAPDRPMLFSKFTNAIVGDGEAVIRPDGTRALDLEVELGVVVGRAARRVTKEQALEHVAGYVVVNDISARDWQGNPQALREGEKGDGQWLRAKGSDTFLPVGPVFATPDEVDPRGGLALRSWRIPGTGDGADTPVLMQDGNTADMLHDVPALVSFVSRSVTLEPGDLIATGTPAGVGVFRDPPVFLEPGDRVRCEIEGIGMVENPIVDWTEDTRPEPW